MDLLNNLVSVTCAGSRWQLDQWRPLHVIMTEYHVLHTTPPKPVGRVLC